MSESDRVSSVGLALRSNQRLDLDHPTYRQFQNTVNDELVKISEREALRQASARPLMFTTYLNPDQLADLARVYPEFQLRPMPLNRKVHPYWEASRLCANEWLAQVSSDYVSSVVHYGGFLMASISQRRSSYHLEYDPTDEVLMHQTHSEAVDVHRAFSDFTHVQSEYGVVLPRAEYDDYLRRRSYNTCTSPATCCHQAQALCVDLSVSALSPEQVALAMLQHGAKLCHGFFIYHPAMLVQETGELPGTDVCFQRTSSQIKFMYPEGRAGVASYHIDMWARWLASHTFSVGSSDNPKWFQLELLKNRNHLMFFRLVAIDAPSTQVVVKHALQLPQAESYVLVRSWKLRDGLRTDPSDPGAWVRHDFLAPERVERRTREFAMQLKASQFNRYAVKKQVRTVHDRWVIRGTAVTTAPVLEPQQLEDLATAIFARVFVDRYESSQLTKHMMDSLKSLAAFTSGSVSQRFLYTVKAVASQCFAALYQPVAGTRDFIDYLRDALHPGDKPTGVSIARAPEYISFESVSADWVSKFVSGGERFYHSRPFFTDVPIPQTSMAGSLAYVLSTTKAQTALTSTVTDGDGEQKWENVVRLCTDLVDTRVGGTAPESTGALVDAVKTLNPVDSVGPSRHMMEFCIAQRKAEETVGAFREADDPDPIGSLNALYAQVLPGVASTSLEYDTFSLSLDPQDRTLAAPYLRMSKYFGLPPTPREYHRSRLNALNVPKRQNTAQEQLTAITARNLAAPAISQPQEDIMVKKIWDNFLDVACVENAREKLLLYQSDPVALEEDAIVDWAKQAGTDKASRVLKQLSDQAKSLERMPVGEYIAMLKSDVKPTLSDKPLKEVTAPQVIVYHESALSALYSSMFRVLVRRFSSLLKPNYHVNLLKNAKDIAEFISANHPFKSPEKFQYLENDFSKFDKSQSQFAFDLEYYVFQQLGLNQDFLDRWYLGHVECTIRSVATGLSLHVMYQRKSGDATTAFGNAILNTLSVSYAYAGTKVKWAVFMGDDSLVCASVINSDNEAVQIMAEVFNLTAKFYITEAPYYASNFVVLDPARLQARLLPDPVKRIEKLSMHIAADDPQWRERHTSFNDSMSGYLDPSSAEQLSVLVPQRYQVSEGQVRAAAAALGTLCRSFDAFVSTWDEKPQILQA